VNFGELDQASNRSLTKLQTDVWKPCYQLLFRLCCL